MSATPEQIETALVKAVGDAIRDHTIANMEWGPLGYDGIAKEIIGMVRIFSTTNAAQSEREKMLLEKLEKIAGEAPAKEPRDEPSVAWPPSWSTDYRDHVNDMIIDAFAEGYARALWESGQIADAALKAAP